MVLVHATEHKAPSATQADAHGLAAAGLLPHGVYIAMNGTLFPWDDVRKNRQAGVFERLT